MTAGGYEEVCPARVLEADCVEAMRELDGASVDAVVTDPPYGIGFMGKEWDGAAIAEAAARDRATRKTLGPESPSRPGRAEPRSSSAYGNEAIIAGPVRGGAAFQAWCESWATEALRVLKPGGHLLAFGGTRTYHRLACAVEDAGFEVRDTICWLYGSGFPKSLDVSKAIDKTRDDREAILQVTTALANAADAAGITRAAIDLRMGTSDMAGWWTSRLLHRCQCPQWDQWRALCELVGLSDAGLDAEVWRLNGRKGQPGHERADREVTDPGGNEVFQPTQRVVNPGTPVLAEAERWQGWGTALKPAHEPVVVARKPLVGTVARNVQAHGTGALNIDGCRVEGVKGDGNWKGIAPPGYSGGWDGMHNDENPAGRWPANVALDPEAARMLDEQSGERPGAVSNGSKTQEGLAGTDTFKIHAREQAPGRGDSGGASRFFYCAKTSRAERNAGLDGFAEREGGSLKAGNGHIDSRVGRVRSDGAVQGTPVPNRQNVHPTVKPVALMRWLVRLVTPPAGLVLDPFCGSGTTGIACVLEGFDFTGIERDPEYVEIAKARIAHAQEHGEDFATPPEPVEQLEGQEPLWDEAA